MRTRLAVGFVFPLLVGTLVGCGPDVPADFPPLHPTQVTVTLDGQPLPDATVSFSPADGGRWLATGITDTAGQCWMRTLAEYEGVVAGDYRVSVRKFTEAGMPPELAAMEDTHSTEYVELYEKLLAEGKLDEPQPLVPERYLLPTTSGFEVTVTEGSNEFTLDLQSGDAQLPQQQGEVASPDQGDSA